jgi:putative pyoverdin transport system ATP-binding/permease protein
LTDDTQQEKLDNVGFGRELFRLFRPFWPLSAAAGALGVLAGLSTAWLLATINDGLHAPGGIGAGMIWKFLGLCVLTLAGNAISGISNSLIGQRIIAALRKDISARIVCAPIAEIERFRVHRLMATLNNDVDTVSAFTFNFPTFAVAFAIALGCIVYMLTLSPLLFLFALTVIVCGLIINHHASLHWQRQYQAVGVAQDELQKQYRAIVEGAKELRLSRPRRIRVFNEQLSSAADLIGDLKTRAMRLFYATDAISSTLFFLVIGLIIALQGRLHIDTRVVSGFVIVLLYIRGPVEQLAATFPALIQARIAFQRIAKLSAHFENREATLLERREPSQYRNPLQSVALRGAEFDFSPTGQVAPFRLGPIDLEVLRGEIIFIVGENGCGKTTLIKLLLSLYSPTKGDLLLNGVPARFDELDDFRQQFSAVFSDYHLFDDLVTNDPATVRHAREYLNKFELGHKVNVEEGAFSTIDLSAGQRKRLALVHAYLEGRPWMMLDEWAADQDPAFRRIFYMEMLPDLKRQGKTLIVISHDDRYFAQADRIVRLEQGRVYSVESVSKSPANSEDLNPSS